MSKSPQSSSAPHRSVVPFYILSFFGNLSIDLAIWSFYFTSVAGLSLAAATAVHALVFLVIGLTDLPTGALADKFGRKLISICGYASRLAGAVLTLVFPDLFGLIAASILTGLGWSLLSGSGEALLYDNLKAQGREAEYSHAFANVMTFCFAARLLGFLVSTPLFEISPAYPYLLMVAGMTAAIGTLVLLPEAPYAKPSQAPGLSLVMAAGRELISAPIFMAFLLPWMFIELLSDGIWISLQPLFAASEAGILWTGPFYALGALGSMYGSQLIKRFSPDANLSAAVLLYIVLMVLGASLLALDNTLLVLTVGIILPSIGWGMGYPLRSALINRAIDSSRRATCLSCYSTMAMILSFFVSTLYGLLNEHRSPQFSMSVTVLLLLLGGVIVKRRLKFAVIQAGTG